MIASSAQFLSVTSSLAMPPKNEEQIRVKARIHHVLMSNDPGCQIKQKSLK